MKRAFFATCVAAVVAVAVVGCTTAAGLEAPESRLAGTEDVAVARELTDAEQMQVDQARLGAEPHPPGPGDACQRSPAASNRARPLQHARPVACLRRSSDPRRGRGTGP